MIMVALTLLLISTNNNKRVYVYGYQTMNRSELHCGTFQRPSLPVAKVVAQQLIVKGKRFIVKGI
jgi:hypothetical protein